MKFRLTTLLLIVVSAAAPAFGANGKSSQWYQVELIVFARDTVTDNEVWPELPEMPDVSRARELIASGRSVGGEPFRLLPASKFRLGGAENRLARKSGYKILKHVAWRQPGLSRQRAIAVHLHSNEPAVRRRAGAGRKLDGTVRLTLSRYLHMDVDLAYREDGGAQAGGGAEKLDGILEGAQQTVYRMVESRRMRSREIHYLDHPKLGVIAVVTPL